ncbi:MAG: peptidylprolyl isomerase [Candidatus Micrarchaeota archaeon]
MVKKGDFIEIEYTGYDKNGNIFDSTTGEIAKKLHNKEGKLLVIFSVDLLVPGMSEIIANMKKGEETEFSLTPDKAFGTRDKNKINIVPLSYFEENDLKPYPGLVVQMETKFGVLNGRIKSVNNGRVLVDFNHPLADQNIKYKLKLVDIFEDVNGKIIKLMELFGINGVHSIEGTKAIVSLIKEQYNDETKKTKLARAIKTTVLEIKDIEFKVM